ncbi:hypothetical protein VM1G_10053 [Cytospora mali]|uniref:Aminoglycoside phosphotransferase domain-containing protein n=1 Tax=Cytospora mali TaxID=578113 RepID=A0A194WCT3_CYTMA|nr:hypothetical protein VM1G_10053 [Valsa mali]
MEDEDVLVQQLLLKLSQTRYACSSLIKLSGGTANFVYRGNLLQPLDSQDGAKTATAKTVVIKHSKDFVPGNIDFALDVTRCIFEKSMLCALANFSGAATTKTQIKAPRLYLFNREENVQILEDCSHTTDLKTILVSPDIHNYLPEPSLESIGRDLGSWLRSFHTWTSAPEQASLRITIGQNEGMRRLKRLITYDSFLEILELYPQLVEGHLEALQTIKEAMIAQFEVDKPPTDGDENWGLIHGDLWTGNVLLPNAPYQAENHPGQEPNRLFIIDWENVQFGHRAIDIGGMMADLYERKHFKSVDAVIPVMRGFAEGYGQIRDEMAFRAAIHAGVHLICWHIRRNPNLPLPAPMDKVFPALKLGRDFILKGWEHDRKWFESSVLAPLFAAG